MTLISMARLRLVKYGRFWLLSGRREVGAEIRGLPENTGDLATLPLADKFYMESQYLQIPTSEPNFKFLARLVPEIWRGS